MPIRLKPTFPFVASDDRPVVPAVRISGAIGMRSPLARSQGAAAIEKALEQAFSIARAPAVAVLVNSPGGSPVQSHAIHRRIRALSAEKEKPVLVFVEDLAASGGYMIACAGDEIIADPSSIVGSIGVVFAGFGFTGLLERVGVERRLHTAGERKAMLDPFRPEREEDVAHLKQMQEDIHAHFIALVKERRGARLSTETELFDGLFWSGRRAMDLGLVDGLGGLHETVRERYGEDASVRLIDPAKGSFWRRLFLGAGEAAAAGALSAVEDRALWARYRL